MANIEVVNVIAAVLLAGLFSSEPTYFEVRARYDGPSKEQPRPAIAVTFLQTDAGVHVNSSPAPRLALAADQNVLDYQPETAKAAPVDPAHVPPLDLSKPVRFPVSIRAGAAKGAQSVKATVTYFYCSDREHWCRRGSEEVAVTVPVP